MKANELIIGDWVCNYNNTPEQLIAIDAYNSSVTGTSRYEYCDMDRIKPIPLTEEILKANGFKQLTREIIDSKKYYFCFREDTALDDEGHQFYIIDIFTFDTWLSLRGILFVHELQHLLRTIHRADFADNFKIMGE